MTYEEMQAAVDALVSAALEKGLVKPVAHLQVNSGEDPMALLRHDAPGGRTYDWRYLHGHGDTPEKALADLGAKITALPSLEERHRTEFLKLAATAADYGHAHGIDVQFINPLTDMMKRLSENALTEDHARLKAAAEDAR